MTCDESCKLQYVKCKKYENPDSSLELILWDEHKSSGRYSLFGVLVEENVFKDAERSYIINVLRSGPD